MLTIINMKKTLTPHTHNNPPNWVVELPGYFKDVSMNKKNLIKTRKGNTC